MKMKILTDFQICISVPLKKQNSLHISKIKFLNGQGGYVLVVSTLKLFLLKNVSMSKNLICFNIFIILATIINVSIII